MRLLHEEINSTRENFKQSTTTCKNTDGGLITRCFRCWKEYVDSLLFNEATPACKYITVQGISILESQEVPAHTIGEVKIAIRNLKANRSP